MNNSDLQKIKIAIKDYALIVLGSALYALSTVLFIFPSSLLLGGTSGISVILESFLPFSPGMILMVINFLLIVLAFVMLGKNMATKTLIGSVCTTLFVGIFENIKGVPYGSKSRGIRNCLSGKNAL